MIATGSAPVRIVLRTAGFALVFAEILFWIAALVAILSLFDGEIGLPLVGGPILLALGYLAGRAGVRLWCVGTFAGEVSRRHLRLVAANVVVAVALIAAGVAADDTAGRAFLLSIGGIALAGVALGQHAWLSSPARRPVHVASGRAPVTGEVGTGVRYSAKLTGAMLGLGLGLGTSGVVLGVTALRVGNLCLVVLAVVVIAGPALLYAVEIARGAVRRGGLWLTPSGVVHRGWAVEATAPWDAVDGTLIDETGHAHHLVVLATDGSARRTSPFWKPPELAAAPCLPIPVAALAGDLDPLRHAIDLYATQPARRSELGTPAAERRLRGEPI